MQLGLATAVLIGANLVAVAIMEIIAHARGTAIIPVGILVTSALLPLLWVKDAQGWLKDNPINSIVILIAAYGYTSGRGRPGWPSYGIGVMLATAEIVTSGSGGFAGGVAVYARADRGTSGRLACDRAPGTVGAGGT
ncbi:MAG: hypothetical protein HYY30_11690 [Chloroflexi bacterium]|nr:hypothetical protein [Chloroflexota bacterium]